MPIANNKVLLRDRKRGITRSVASLTLLPGIGESGRGRGWEGGVSLVLVRGRGLERGREGYTLS